MSDSIGSTVALGLIKSVACVYDVVTLPIYFLVQQPWKANSASSETKSRSQRPEDPYSPWSRVGTPPDHDCYKVQTINELVSKTCAKYSERKSFGYRECFGEEDEKQADGKVFKKQILGDYKWLTYAELDQRIDQLARGLMQHGVKPRDNVLIFAETRLEWMLSAQAIFRLGGTIATLYATLGDEAIVHGINETEITHLITTHDLLPKIENIHTRIPYLKTVIYIEGFNQAPVSDIDRIKLISFREVEASGRNTEAKTLKFIPPSSDDPAVIMYTSGSTGVPKGVIITHKNVLTTIGGFFAVAYSLTGTGSYMAYLPLAHVLELAAECFFFSIGTTIGYSTPHTMTDKSTAIKKGQHGDAVHLQPTIMAAVPLVLDRIRKGIVDQTESQGKFMKAFFNFVMDYKKFWTKKGFNTPIVNALVCKKIRSMLGGKISHIVCGSAPLSPETHEFIRACLDVTLIQGYGLTETAAGATLMDLNDRSVGRVGPPLHGVKIKLVDWEEGNYHVNDVPYPRGEICIGGGCTSAGYFKNEQLTQESFRDEDGEKWFYTGDIGEVHPDGSFKIIDRKKDLVKLQFGEYISLGKVETELKSCPIVDNICVYGDSYHTYVIALVVPNAKALSTLAKQQGKEHLSHERLCRDPEIVAAISKAIVDHARKAKLHKMETPTKFMVCSEDWSPDSGLVTAAMKIRRRNIQDFYKLDINRLYGIENGNAVQSKST